jgi:putative transcriptional regulator
MIVRGPALTALALCAGLALGNPSRAESVTVCEARFDFDGVKETVVDTAPVILVANPSFKDPRRREQHRLAAPLPNGGHVGVIINRPMQVNLGQLFPEHGPTQKVLEPVYYGGPFLGNGLVALVRSGEVLGEGSLALTPDLVLATGAETIDRIIEQAPAGTRYYLGIVLWRPGELVAELETGLWSVHGASTGTVSRTDMELLWKELPVKTRGTLVGGPLPTLAFVQESRVPQITQK